MTNEKKATLKRLGIDLGYLVVWGVITFVSSYNLVLHDCSLAFITSPKQDINFFIIPLVIWLVAYVVDFGFTVQHKKNFEKFSKTYFWIAALAIGFFLLFLCFILAQSSYFANFYETATPRESWLSLDDRIAARTFALGAMFIFILLLKWSSLQSLHYDNSVKNS